MASVSQCDRCKKLTVEEMGFLQIPKPPSVRATMPGFETTRTFELCPGCVEDLWATLQPGEVWMPELTPPSPSEE